MFWLCEMGCGQRPGEALHVVRARILWFDLIPVLSLGVARGVADFAPVKLVGSIRLLN